MSEWLKSVTIRPLREIDLYDIEWDGEFSRYRKIYREIYRNALSKRSILFVAETTATGIIGQFFLTKKNADKTFSPHAPYLFLSSFRVKNAYRNLGLGTQLLTTAETTATEQGFNRIILNSAKDNVRIRRFYENHGFSVFREDLGIWAYTNHHGEVVTEITPAWSMIKII